MSTDFFVLDTYTKKYIPLSISNTGGTMYKYIVLYLKGDRSFLKKFSKKDQEKMLKFIVLYLKRNGKNIFQNNPRKLNTISKTGVHERKENFKSPISYFSEYTPYNDKNKAEQKQAATRIQTRMRINKAKKELKKLRELRKNPQEQLLPSTQIKLTESIHKLEQIIILDQLQEKKDDEKQEIDEKLQKKKDVMMIKIDGQLGMISENGLKKNS